MIRLRFLGGTGTVTGSKFLLHAGGATLLVDCGLFQGYKNLRLRNWAPLPVDPRRIGAVVLTHAHLDHSGYLPVLARNGFRGRIYCTESTRELCAILLRDAAFLQEEQARHANRHGWSRHKPALPLFDRKDAELALGLMWPVPFHRAFNAAPHAIGVFRRAGHILGAASVTLECEGRTLAFSGDLGREDDTVMRAPEPIESADVLLLESTYGDRLHERGDTTAVLGRLVTEAAARGGSVIIPSFAVGRAQALLLHLHHLRQRRDIPPSMPIYLDSPMATDVTSLYLRTRGEHRLTDAECRAIAGVARRVTTPEESRELDESDWPKIVIAGSGMAAGGRVLHHIKRYGPDPRSLILFAGYQAGGTRGDALVKGATEVKIHGGRVPIRARVRNLDGLSAHADAGQLVDWLRHLKRAPERLFLVHGEPAAQDALRRRIAEALGWTAGIPDYLERVQLTARGSGA